MKAHWSCDAPVTSEFCTPPPSNGQSQWINGGTIVCILAAQNSSWSLPKRWSFSACLSIAPVPSPHPPVIHLCLALIVGLTVVTVMRKLFRVMSVRLNVTNELKKRAASRYIVLLGPIAPISGAPVAAPIRGYVGGGRSWRKREARQTNQDCLKKSGRRRPTNSGQSTENTDRNNRKEKLSSTKAQQ